MYVRMDTLGELLVVTGVGVACLLIGHHVGKCAGWCERDTQARKDAARAARVDHYGESEN